MRDVCNFCDYFVIVSASSKRRVKTISEKIQEALKKKQLKISSCEGESEDLWILLDYLDVIVHIFYKPLRDFYDLERIWADAKRIEDAPFEFRRENLRGSKKDIK